MRGGEGAACKTPGVCHQLSSGFGLKQVMSNDNHGL